MQRMCVFRIFARALGLLLLVGLLFPEFAFAQALSSATINDPTLGRDESLYREHSFWLEV